MKGLGSALRGRARDGTGFTLIEMLIVVAIIAILIAVSIPMMNGALEQSRNATDMANVRAAKGWALMDYMKPSDDTTKIVKPATGADAVVYYDAGKGECKKTRAEVSKPYGQSKKGIPNSTDTTYGDFTAADAKTPENRVISLTIDVSGQVTNVSWVD